MAGVHLLNTREVWSYGISEEPCIQKKRHQIGAGVTDVLSCTARRAPDKIIFKLCIDGMCNKSSILHRIAPMP